MVPWWAEACPWWDAGGRSFPAAGRAQRDFVDAGICTYLSARRWRRRLTSSCCSTRFPAAAVASHLPTHLHHCPRPPHLVAMATWPWRPYDARRHCWHRRSALHRTQKSPEFHRQIYLFFFLTQSLNVHCVANPNVDQDFTSDHHTQWHLAPPSVSNYLISNHTRLFSLR